VRFELGCVPYVNARPLVEAFETGPLAERAHVTYKLPSSLPAAIDSGEVHAALTSSFDALRTPGRCIAGGACIGTRGAAESVRLFSKKPIAEIRSLALDASSLTSNHLAQIILAERYGAKPQVLHAPPVQEEMLAKADACVLIGDIGMIAPGEGLHVLDLGAEWLALTGLPFVWAAWTGDEGLSPDLAALLLEAREWGEANLETVIDKSEERVSWPEGAVRSYLSSTMSYELSPEHLEGMRLFQRKLSAHGFIPDQPFPRMQAPPTYAR